MYQLSVQQTILKLGALTPIHHFLQVCELAGWLLCWSHGPAVCWWLGWVGWSSMAQMPMPYSPCGLSCWASSHDRNISKEGKQEPSLTSAKTSPLPHHISQSKLQGQPRFNGRWNRFHPVVAEAESHIAKRHGHRSGGNSLVTMLHRDGAQSSYTGSACPTCEPGDRWTLTSLLATTCCLPTCS